MDYGIGVGGDGFRMIQAPYMYCTLHFYYDISFTSYHQALLDPEAGDPCSKPFSLFPAKEVGEEGGPGGYELDGQNHCP